MPINIRQVEGVNDGAEMFQDGTQSSVANTNQANTINNTTVNKPNAIETAFNNVQENDALLADNEGKFTNVPLNTIIGQATELTQGYYGLLSGFYFSGTATETIIDGNNVNTFVDVIMNVDANGTFDKRPQAMKDAFPQAVEGDGSEGNPIIFSLEGLDTNSFANFRASMAFEPDEDEILKEIIPKSIATSIFSVLQENAASEQGSRMAAMDNATRNAGEMIDKLTIDFNRSRQAAITNELIEIISGAEAL